MVQAMSIRIDDALGVHTRALGLHMKRTEILAANLANEDTPEIGRASCRERV